MLTVVNTNPILIDWLKQGFGGYTGTYQYGNPDWKLSYVWRLTGVKAIELVKSVRPFLKLKAPHADQLLAFWDLHESWGVVGGTQSHWGYAASAEVMVEAMSILNQKGAREKTGKELNYGQ